MEAWIFCSLWPIGLNYQTFIYIRGNPCRVERKGPHLIAWIDSSVTRLLVQSFVCQPNTISYHMVTFRRTFSRPVPLFVIRILSLWCNHTIKPTMNFLIVKIGLIVWSGIDISLFSHLQIFWVYKKRPLSGFPLLWLTVSFKKFLQRGSSYGNLACINELLWIT